ncbi:hypothetical protein QEN19_003748 [Hanseniaspora menglaensis]
MDKDNKPKGVVLPPLKKVIGKQIEFMNSKIKNKDSEGQLQARQIPMLKNLVTEVPHSQYMKESLFKFRTKSYPLDLASKCFFNNENQIIQLQNVEHQNLIHQYQDPSLTPFLEKPNFLYNKGNPSLTDSANTNVVSKIFYDPVYKYQGYDPIHSVPRQLTSKLPHGYTTPHNILQPNQSVSGLPYQHVNLQSKISGYPYAHETIINQEKTMFAKENNNHVQNSFPKLREKHQLLFPSSNHSKPYVLPMFSENAGTDLPLSMHQSQHLYQQYNHNDSLALNPIDCLEKSQQLEIISNDHNTTPKTKKLAHKSKKSMSFPCTICGKPFNRFDTLKTHMNMHLGLKPFRCSVCGKNFNAKQNMMRHHRNHSKK